MTDPLSPALRSVISARLSNGIDGREARTIVQAARREPDPEAALAAVRDDYEAQFTSGGKVSFERAVAVALMPTGVSAAGVREATSHTVGLLREKIAALGDEIRGLEANNTQKAAQVSRILEQIESRKAQLQGQFERKRNIGMMAAMFGMPMVAKASLLMMIDDDARLRSLRGDLQAAQADKSKIDQQLRDYQQLKTTLGWQLRELEVAAAALKNASPANVVGDVAVAAARLNEGEALVQNLKSQVALLEQLRDAAGAIGVDVDDLLHRVTLQLVRAETLVEQSRKATFNLIELVTSKDPEAAAQKWVDKTLATRTKAVLRRHGLQAGAFIDHLVKQAFPKGGPAAELLRNELRQSFSIR